MGGSMDSNDENDVVTPRDASSFVPQAPPVQKDNVIFSETAQLINGRAAMVGFVSAVAGEIITKKEAFELLFPAKMVSGVSTHVIDAQNFSLFAFAIVMVTLGTITPKFTQDNFDESREFAIFKTNSEKKRESGYDWHNLSTHCREYHGTRFVLRVFASP